MIEVNLTTERICCPIHYEPFRLTFPKGWGLFARTLVQTVLKTQVTSSTSLERLLDEVPLCCRCPRSELLLAYRNSAISIDIQCSQCSTLTKGFHYQPNPMDAVRYVCWRCFMRKALFKA